MTSRIANTPHFLVQSLHRALSYLDDANTEIRNTVRRSPEADAVLSLDDAQNDIDNAVMNVQKSIDKLKTLIGRVP